MKSKSFLTTLLGCLLALTTYAQVDETHVRLTNLPHVYINTFSGSDIYSKTNYVMARMWYVDEKDSVAFYDSLQIRGRGNSTWNLAKKPYRIKFQKKEKFLGKGYAKTKKWTLLANHADKTLIRNALTRQLGERLGLKFNPAAKFVDLTLNGQYIGNYQISDQIDVRPHRVNITEQDVALTDTSNITGGYLLEVDGFFDFQDGTTGYYTKLHSVPIRIHYPDEDEIDPRQFNYISQFTNDFERLLFSTNFADAELGYRPRVDSTSLANWYLATEISGNIDGFFSTYFYKDRDDDRFYWGPLWDYDIAYGNDNRKGDTTRQLMRDVAYGSAMRNWILRLWQDPWFTNLIATRYYQAIDDGLESYMLTQIDSLTSLLDQSQELNYERWSINQRALRERVLYSTYNEYVIDLRNYVTRRLSYMTELLGNYIPEEPQPLVPDFEPDTLFYYAISNLGAGTYIDIDANDNICANQRNEESESQQWRILPLSNGHMFIVNRMTGRALNDPTAGEPTATTLVGTRLNTTEADSTDTRQQWDLVKQNDNCYNLINHFSQHAANLSGGNNASGASVISYTNNERNSTSKNRMWRIDAVAEVEKDDPNIPGDGITGTLDYALAYNPGSDYLHFGADDLTQLAFTVRLYHISGRLVRTFRAADGCHLTGLPRGTYIVSWQFQGRQRAVKFTK